MYMHEAKIPYFPFTWLYKCLPEDVGDLPKADVLQIQKASDLRHQALFLEGHTHARATIKWQAQGWLEETGGSQSLQDITSASWVYHSLDAQSGAKPLASMTLWEEKVSREGQTGFWAASWEIQSYETERPFSYRKPEWFSEPQPATAETTMCLRNSLLSLSSLHLDSPPQRHLWR